VLGDTARHLADHYPVETWRPHRSVGTWLFEEHMYSTAVPVCPNEGRPAEQLLAEWRQ